MGFGKPLSVFDPAHVLLGLLLRELVVLECFKSFQTHELTRLPCSFCGKQCKSYVRKAGHDVYGHKIDNHDANGELVTCSICKKAVSAARFAPHLEKCMGMGRLARTKRNPVGTSRSTPVKNVPSNPVIVAVDDNDDLVISSQTLPTDSDAKKKKRKIDTSTPNSAVSLLQLDDDIGGLV